MIHAIQLANSAYAAASGYTLRAYDAVRNWSSERRRDEPPLSTSTPRNLGRIDFPIARPALNPSTLSPPASSQPMEQLLFGRKRKPDVLLSPMSRVKRQDHGYNKPSPWSEDTWAQQLAANLNSKFEDASNKYYKKWNRRRTPRKQYSLHGIRYQRSPSPKITKPCRVRLHLPRPDHFEEAYRKIYHSHSHGPNRFYTSTASHTPGRFTTPDESPPRRAMSDKQRDIDEDTLQAQVFAFVQPRETEDILNQDKTDPFEGSEEQENDLDTEEDADWDEDGSKEHRKTLRRQSAYFDEEGFKLPINGTISPYTQQWNKEHGRKLLEDAALQQQTPSKPPKHSTSKPATLSPKLAAASPTVLSNAIAADDNLQGELKKIEDDPFVAPKTVTEIELAVPKASEVEDTKLPLPSPKTILSTSHRISSDDASAVNVEDTQETVVLHTSSDTSVSIAQTVPNNEIITLQSDVKEEASIGQSAVIASTKLVQNLSLNSSTGDRTPKSGEFDKLKSEREEEQRKRLAEIEEAKNAYPLVPISKGWNVELKKAVYEGTDRISANSFRRCLPQYYTLGHGMSSWLDDAVINDYMNMLVKHGCRDDRKGQKRSIAAITSFFFPKIAASTVDWTMCAKYLKGSKIPGLNFLDCHKIFIPICRSSHWTLAVIERKVPEGGTANQPQRTVTVYNSMGSSGNRENLAIIMNWIRHDLGTSFNQAGWLEVPFGESPQQSNTDDCGVFTCTTARQILLDKYGNATDRYVEADIAGMRRRIAAELLHEGLLNKDESSK